MDEQEELPHIGLFGIHRAAYQITVSWRKIFSQITLSLILPLSIIFLAQIPFSELLISKINTAPGANSSIALYAFRAGYSLFILILFLASTAMVVQTVASTYYSEEVTFKKAISVVPKLWKSLMITFLWYFLIVFLFSLFAVALILLFAAVITILLRTGAISPIGTTVLTYYIIFLLILLVPYVIGVAYISLIWHLANVLTVLEETSGLAAMKDSKRLIKGKMWTACAIFVEVKILISAIVLAFYYLVVHGESIGMVGRVSFGILFVLLLAILIHFALVMLTIFYFLCKSCHNESIDNSYLADYLGVHRKGVYAPLISDQNA